MPKSKRATNVRTAHEFNLTKLKRVWLPPRQNSASYAWNADAIIDARDQQSRGQFATPAKLAKKIREDDALFSAWQVRMSPEAAIAIAIEAASGARGASIANEAEALFGANGIGLRPETRQDVLDDLVNHGVAFAYNTHKPREDGARIDIEVNHWPAEHVHYDEMKRALVTRLDPSCGGHEIEINHGDGTWIVFAKTRNTPWNKHAALLPAALVWSTHAFAIRDWASASYSHGNAKVVGELPEGFSFFDAEGEMTEQAQAFYEIVQAAAGSDDMAAIIPPGSKLESLANPSSVYQIWQDIVSNRERAAHRVYCGTDASLGSPGGAPGVDILTLFGVSNTIGEGDVRAIARGVQEGVIDVWCALNFGDSSLAPRFAYLVPNADEEAARAGYGERVLTALEAIAKTRAVGLPITAEYLEEIRVAFAVSLPDLPPEQSASDSSVVLAPTDIAAIVMVNEARASVGLPPIPGGDDITLEQYRALQAAPATAPPASTPTDD